jgi:predicted secreted hydrolase
MTGHQLEPAPGHGHARHGQQVAVVHDAGAVDELDAGRGDRINLWDLFAEGSEFPYATVLRPDGTHEIVAVNPLADTTSEFWTSPTTGKRYGTRWTVNIPALDASLTVVAQPQGQEVQSYGGVFEGAASVTGRYRGKPVTGQAYVEQLGNWR